MEDAEKSASNKKIEPAESKDQLAILSFFSSENIFIRVLNFIGAIGTLWAVIQFLITLWQIGDGRVDAGLYVQSFIVVFSFFLFVNLSSYKLSQQHAFIIFLSSAYAITFSLILIASFYIASGTVLERGLDFDILSGGAIYEPSSSRHIYKPHSFSYVVDQLTQSSTILSVIMFCFAYFGASFFLKRAHDKARQAAPIPIFIFFLWILNELAFRGRVAAEFSEGVNSEKFFAYTLIMLMTLAMVSYGRMPLRQ